MRRTARSGRTARTWIAAAVMALGALLATGPGAASATDGPMDLLPALEPLQRELADNDLVREPDTGITWLRFTGAPANLGSGALHVTGRRTKEEAAAATPGNNVIPAYQRISRSDGSSYEVPVGLMTYHDEHKHFHMDGISRYRLINAGGQVVRESPKVAFCLVDLEVADSTLPGSPVNPVYNSCSHNANTTTLTMGISVGWADVYAKELGGQSFDVSALMNLPPQEYTLEMTTNPLGILHESNRTAPRTTSVKVTIGQGVPVGVGGPRPGV
ncbi:lysyl oxidase family protein [Streptomyces spiramyceticus]|uniref:lysyl oxidase family protein n=1 Tax=Streptomyces spiramyceticus TaxID=299717 RepID=UPI00237B1D01|nr:lysyl oxidase family protein [Streptomyces spiramyceticus]